MTLEVGGRSGLKWSSYPADVLAAWVAEMDFGLAPLVGEALAKAVERGDTGYAYPALVWEMAVAASSYWSQSLSFTVDAERIFPVPDVIEGIRRAIMLLTKPDSPVILHTPVYHPFFWMVERAGRQLVEVPSPRAIDGRYQLDYDAIGAALAGGAGAIVLCNPWNPTGRSLTREEIAPVLGLAAAHSARVITDEVHAALTYPGVEHSVAAVLDPEVVITVTSASKAWNIPGLKCAQVVLTNDRDLAAWGDYFTLDRAGVGTLGLVANTAAYAGGAGWLAGVKDRLTANRQLLSGLVAARLPLLGYSPPEATYLALLDFAAFGLEDPAAFLLDRAKVALTPGAPFRGDAASSARLNFATSPEILTEIIERIEGALDSLAREPMPNQSRRGESNP